jgi:PAS domain S-box-containing protein
MTEGSNSAVELRLRAAVDAALSGILMTDSEGRIVLVNRQIESMFGYEREEMLGRPVEMLLPERFRGAHPGDRATFMTSPRVRSMGLGRDLHGLRKDGTEVPLEIGLTPVATDAGMFVLSTMVDLSARERAEERFRLAVESSPSGMIMIDGEGRIVLVNREIERMFGYAREELLGQPVERLVPARFQDAHPGHRVAFYRDPHARSMGVGRELFGVHKAGTELPIEIGLNPIRTEDGLLVLASVVDISARKRAERDRNRLEDQLRQSQKMEAIGRLASGVAHDFNNLLMGIIGCGELVKRSLPPGHETRSTVQEICDAAQRGASLTRDLLDFSRRKPIDAVPSKLNAVVRVAERMLRQVIGEDIALEVELSESGGPILANPTHLEHILLNLAVNARDAMPNGGRLRIATSDRELEDPLTTRSRALPAASYVVLEVEDSGSGMDAATQARVFEPFFTTKPVGSGTGLGLYTVHSVVQQLDGGIDFTSEPGRGTRFTVYFPRHEGLSAVIPSVEARRAERPQSASLIGRILVVEDERLIRITLRQMLSALGHEVLVAENAERAIQIAREQEAPIDLLLSDIVLPDASGTDIAEVLTQERPELRVLFMSAYPADLLVQQGRIQPGTKTLEKPFDELTLASAIQESLAKEPEPPRSAAR